MRWIAVIILALLLSCSSKKADSGAKGQKRSMPDDSLYTLAAQRVVYEFKRELKGALMAAMKEGGPVKAIGVCRTTAPEIAVKNSEPGIYAIKRVTDRNRNPGNLADSVEAEILAAFADTTKEQQSFISQWHVKEDKRSFTFYEPIHVGQICMSCHGSVESLKDEVREALRSNYPEDKATGYQPGDLRGLFVVEIAWPQGREWAETVIAKE